MTQLADKKTMLVDESAFYLDPLTDEAKIRNAFLLTFLNDARNQFDIVVVTRRPVESLRTELNARNLSEAFNPEHQLDQSFLLESIQRWDRWENCSVGVLITKDEGQKCLLEDYRHILSPDSMTRPFYFHYFFENYDEPEFGNPKVWAALSASVAMSEVKITTALGKTYIDPESVWKKILVKPEVKTLLDLFSEARQLLHQTHPQDKVTADLKFYFQYAAVGNRISDVRVVSELLCVRRWMGHQFLDANVEGFYGRDEKNPRKLTQKHKQTLDAALIAINKIIREEPRLQGT